ncbi:hypothetical protein QTH87_05985 [Variovorax sp. J22P168]|uniref:hypothetical protein n=1 Tax=Variovorax jilinensis TaxID=3053513 RepID=UPI002578480D|nr:hypothetical protein [Variovorax sp. J22P168]MDM0011988.1 hypothetical protein [Variovorax sp. J22P168]
MRHAAWLAAVPADDSSTARVTHPASPQSRGAQREAAGFAVDMPPLDAAAHLVDVLWQIGPSMPTGMGAVPISFGEMQAWQQQTGYALGSWEVRTLRRMSAAYVAQAEEARQRDCPPPWLAKEAPREGAKTARRIRAFLRD